LESEFNKKKEGFAFERLGFGDATRKEKMRDLKLTRLIMTCFSKDMTRALGEEYLFMYQKEINHNRNIILILMQRLEVGLRTTSSFHL
jgi:hypothetical protein